jgi:hypothetical protein
MGNSAKYFRLCYIAVWFLTASGQVSGNFNYAISSTGATTSTLTLSGTVSGGQITGSWTVTGSSAECSGSGTFTMTPMPAV